MTELSFLLDLLLNHRLPKPVKILIADRIKEIEGRQPMSRIGASLGPSVGQQAPSTMANLSAEMVPPPMPVKRIVGGEIDTGNGTRGPRKF